MVACTKVLRVFSVFVLVAALALPGQVFATEQLTVARNTDLAKEAEAKIDSEVLEAFQNQEVVDVLVMLKDQVDTERVASEAVRNLPSHATAYEKKMESRFAVVDALRDMARETQRPILDHLRAEEAKGTVVEVNPFYIVNIIHVRANEEIIQNLALRPEVEVILPNNKIALEMPEIDSSTVDSIEWNIDRIGAQAVWDVYGIDGSGVVVGIIDTGTHWQHEALMTKWRGYDPDGNHDPTFNWFDAVAGQSMPYDLTVTPHGTHVMGTILGSDPAEENLIGVAPGAQWITARAFEEDGAYEHWLLAAGEYILAPTDEQGNPHPEKAPDIVNNSWGGGSGLNEWYRPMVQAWRAAGIFPVFSAGNTSGGSSPGSVSVPANYPESFAVAATDVENLRASFSNQGPGPYADDLKPDISAPGVNIRSSVPGGYQAGWSGTSMAAPHITGTAALLLSFNAALTPAQLEQIMVDTATALTDSQYPDSPNYGYGHGLVNAFDAVASTLSGFGVISGQVLREGNDTEPPEITHEPVEFVYMDSVPIYAQVTDDIAVTKAEVWMRPFEQDWWVVIPMELMEGDHLSGQYLGTIPWTFVEEPGFEYKIVASDWGNNEIHTPVYVVDVLFGAQPDTAWDFEQYPQGWYWDGDWDWGEPTVGPQPVIGSKLVATNPFGNYSINSDSWLLTPPLDLRDASEASLRLHHWYDIELNWDTGVVAVTDTYGEEWETIGEFTGREQEWRNLVIDLNSYAGSDEPVYVLFAFMSDGSVVYPGWYVDNVQFWGVDEVAPSEPTDLTAAVSSSGVVLNWAGPEDPDLSGYNVYRSQTAGAGYELIATADNTSYSDAEAEAGIEHFYVVTAYDFSGNESGYSNEVSAVPLEVSVLFYSDFESDDGGFTTDGNNNTWEWGAPVSGPNNAFSGTNVWATNLAGNYLNSADCWIQTPVVDLTGLQIAELEFAHWYNFERNWDYGLLEISTDNGETWLELASYTDLKESWDLARISLDPYIGQEVSLRFRHTSDGSVNRLGWYIDDVKVSGIPGEAQGKIEAPEPIAVDYVDMSKPKTSHPEINRRLRRDPSEFEWYRSDEIRSLGTSGGLPLDALVTVVESNRTVRTNPVDGSFYLPHPATPAGEEWTLRVESYGFHTLEVPFILEDGDELEYTFTMEEVPKGTISGNVIDSRTGEPISDALATVVEDKRIPGVYTDSEGNFTLENVIEGQYTLRISAQGYHGEEISVEVIGDEVTTISVELRIFIGYDEEIAYDDGVAENARAFYDQGNGWAVRMTPEGMIQVKGANIYFWGTDWPVPGGVDYSVAVFDSTASGEPGEMVIPPVAGVATRGDWNFIDLSDFGFSTDRDFYVVMVQVGDHPNTPGLGFDESSYAGRSYMYVDGGFQLLDSSYGNAMVRAVVTYSLGEPVITSPEDGSFTNQDTVAVTGTVDMDSLVRVFVNGEEAAAVESQDNQFDVEVELVEGENIITATAAIEAGETDPSAPVVIVKDTILPELQITGPEDGFITNKEVITVTGIAADDNLAQVTVNGSVVDVDADGSFSTRVLVDEGENVIQAEAVDFAGNSSDAEVRVVVDLTDPTMENIEPSTDQVLRRGEVLEVSFNTDAFGGTAFFMITLPGEFTINADMYTMQGGANMHAMEEVAEGYFVGTWTVPDGLRINDALIQIEVFDIAGNRSTAIAEGRLTIKPGGGPGGPRGRNKDNHPGNRIPPGQMKKN